MAQGLQLKLDSLSVDNTEIVKFETGKVQIKDNTEVKSPTSSSIIISPDSGAVSSRDWKFLVPSGSDTLQLQKNSIDIATFGSSSITFKGNVTIDQTLTVPTIEGGGGGGGSSTAGTALIEADIVPHTFFGTNSIQRSSLIAADNIIVSSGALPAGLRYGHLFTHLGLLIYAGGEIDGIPVNTIYIASAQRPDVWTNPGYILPYTISRGVPYVGSDGYYILGGAIEATAPTNTEIQEFYVVASVAQHSTDGTTINTVANPDYTECAAGKQIRSAFPNTVGAETKVYHEWEISGRTGGSSDIAPHQLFWGFMDISDVGGYQSGQLAYLNALYTANSIAVEVHTVYAHCYTDEGKITGTYIVNPGSHGENDFYLGTGTSRIQLGIDTVNNHVELIVVKTGYGIIAHATFTDAAKFGGFAPIASKRFTAFTQVGDTFPKIGRPATPLGSYQGTLITSPIFIDLASVGGSPTDKACYVAVDNAISSNWTELVPTIPVPLMNASVARYNDKIAVLGGTTTTETDISTVYTIDKTTPTTWTSVGNNSFTSSSAMVCLIGNIVYLMGGKINDVVSNKIYSANFTALESLADTINTIPGNLTRSTLAIVNDKVILYGGLLDDVATDKIYIGTISDGLATWTTSANVLSAAIYGARSCFIDGQIYLYGGDNSGLIHSTRDLEIHIDSDANAYYKIRKEDGTNLFTIKSDGAMTMPLLPIKGAPTTAKSVGIDISDGTMYYEDVGGGGGGATVSISDNNYLYLGDSNDLAISHQSGTGKNIIAAASGDIEIQGIALKQVYVRIGNDASSYFKVTKSTGEDILTLKSDGAMTMPLLPIKGAPTTPKMVGIDINNGTVYYDNVPSVGGSNATFLDDILLRFGTGNDMTIRHQSSTTENFIEVAAGHLTIEGAATQDVRIKLGNDPTSYHKITQFGGSNLFTIKADGAMTMPLLPIKGAPTTPKMVGIDINNGTVYYDDVPTGGGGSTAPGTYAAIEANIVPQTSFGTHYIQRSSQIGPDNIVASAGTMPTALKNGHLFTYAGYLIYAGGEVNGIPVNTIYRATVQRPDVWTNTGYTLPYTISRGITHVASDGYYILGGGISSIVPPLDEVQEFYVVAGVAQHSTDGTTINTAADPDYTECAAGKQIRSAIDVAAGAETAFYMEYEVSGRTGGSSDILSHQLFWGFMDISNVSGYQSGQLGYKNPLYSANSIGVELHNDAPFCYTETTKLSGTYIVTPGSHGENDFFLGTGTSRIQLGIDTVNNHVELIVVKTGYGIIAHATFTDAGQFEGFTPVASKRFTAFTHVGDTFPKFGRPATPLGSYQGTLITTPTYLGVAGASTFTPTDKACYVAIDNIISTNWTEAVPTIPVPLMNASVARYNDKVAVLGGTTTGDTDVNTVYEIDETTPTTWTSVGNNSITFSSATVCVYGDTIYMIGGRVNTFISTQIFSTSTASPHTLTDTTYNIPDYQYNAGYVIINNQVIMYGGKTNVGVTNKIYIGDLSSGLSTWNTSTTTLTNNSYGVVACLINDHVYLFGGDDSGTIHDTRDVSIDIDSNANAYYKVRKSDGTDLLTIKSNGEIKLPQLAAKGAPTTAKSIGIDINDGTVYYDDAAGGGGFKAASDPVEIGESVNGNSNIGGIAIGSTALLNTNCGDAIAIGTDAQVAASRTHAIALGVSTRANDGNSIAIGTNAISDGSNSVALAPTSWAKGNDCISIGRNSTAGTVTINASTAVGYSAKADGEKASAFGTEAYAWGTDSVAVGKTATCNQHYSVGIGANVICNGYESVAIGRGATANGTFTVSLGYTGASEAYGVYLGENSGSGRVRARDATILAYTSDIRDKTDVVDITYGLGFLKDLAPREYKLWDRDDRADVTKKSSRVRQGYIAQEVQDALDLHGCDNFGYLYNMHPNRDLVVNPIHPDERDQYTFGPTSLIPVLHKAILELSTTVTTQAAQIADLISRVETLEAV